MKKLFITVAALLIGASFASAQDMATVTETYNNGANALAAENYSDALFSFKAALEGAEALGEEGAEIVSKCKNYIPEIQFLIAKKLVNNQDYDNAVAELGKTVEIAKAYGADETASSAADLIPQVLMQKANALLNAKDFAAAVGGYKAVIAADPSNGVAALRLGAALNSMGDKEAAIEAFKQAIANGQEKAAVKQISNIYLKNAAAALKAKNYAGAIEEALKVNEYGDNAKAYQIAAQASQSLKKNSDAIAYFEKYLELSPNAGNFTQVAYTVAALYQQQGNKAKAVEFYQKAVTDPKFGAEAQKQINALK
ncbi:MAG: tetratricopeptide repeat protein [Bacteroidales bacterium]|nr:tetratricopeptide repeat protein [Bacteroidales bacterium]